MLRHLLQTALILTLSISGAALQAEEGGKPAEQAKEHGAPKGAGAHGEITAVDAAAGTITVKAKGKEGAEKIFKVTDATMIKVDGQKAALADIKVGGKAMVKADGETASSIMVGEPKKKEKKEKKEGKEEKKDNAE